MRVAVLCTGNELLLGRTTNTNLAQIARALSEVGIEVIEERCVPDDAKIITRAIKALLQESQVLILTGGLGPTQDDLTLEVVAKFLGKKLHFDQALVEQCKEICHLRGIEPSRHFLRQAAVPAGATPITNQVGRALGFHARTRKVGKVTKHIIALPGVPAEMQAMLGNYVVPTLQSLATQGEHPLALLTARFLGTPESIVDHALRDWQLEKSVRKPARLITGTYIRFPEVQLVCRLYNHADPEAVFTPIRNQINQRLGNTLVAFDNELPEQSVHRIFRDRLITLALAESCTGGFISSRLVALPGASNFFKGAAVAYANSVKQQSLEVPAAVLQKHGAVSPECALAMADGVRKVYQSDIGVGVTGILGPDGGTYDKPVGTVYVAFTTALAGGKQQVEKYQLIRRERLLGREEVTVRALIQLGHFATTLTQ